MRACSDMKWIRSYKLKIPVGKTWKQDATWGLYESDVIKEMSWKTEQYYLNDVQERIFLGKQCRLCTESKRVRDVRLKIWSD